MSNGLIQFIQSDASDIFLTGNPTITYFKSIYRRYTNFSVVLKELKFNTNANFDLISTITIPKYADLLHKLYLKITIPQFSINYKLTIEEQELLETYQLAYEEYLNKYKYLKIYFQYNYEEYSQILNSYNINKNKTFSLYQTDDTILNSWYDIIDTLENEYNNKFNTINANTDITKYNHEFIISNLLIEFNKINNTNFTYDNNGTISLCSLREYMSKSTETNKLQAAKLRCDFYINKCQQLDKEYYTYIVSLKEKINELNKQYYKFAWTDKLGYDIIDYVELSIGGQVIDKQYGQWMNIWHELTSDKAKEDKFNILIGSVPELTTYDTTIKPSYTLYVPLSFWFCNSIHNALPLIALPYSDIILNVKFRKFSDCAYSSFKFDINDPFTDLLDNIIHNEKLTLDVSLLAEYIYLSNEERRLFAKASHEYLIDQTQMQVTNNVNTIAKSLKLNFLHPCKGFVWIAQYSKKYKNIDNTNKCLWNNYAFELNKTSTNIINNETHCITRTTYINPFKHCEIALEGRNVAIRLSGLYYNYVQPNQVFKNTPSLGLNSFWFSLFPTETQPSGFCNVSYIRDCRLNYTLDIKSQEKDVYNLEAGQIIIENYIEPYDITIFALNYNILRISSGIASLAYL